MIRKLTAVSLLMTVASFPGAAMATSCGSDISGQSPAVKMLQRQLSALRSIQRGRGCKPDDTSGGLFNACREVGMKISEVQQELRATAAANHECKAQAQTAPAKEHTKSKAKNVTAAAGTAGTQPAMSAAKEVRGPKHALQYCVRLSDGYYFPTPNSQYKQKGGTDAALVQCKMICKTDAMAVYINDQNKNAADMVSVLTGEVYADLATAYNYHGAGKFERCDWNGYVRKISSRLAARKQSKRLVDVGLPKLDARADVDPVDVSEIPSQSFRPDPSQSVRIVGPAFIPDADNKAFGHIRRQ